MKNFAIKQAMWLPLLGMLIPMVTGFFTPGYSSLAQQMSELEHAGEPYDALVRIGALLCGLSIMLFAVTLAMRPWRYYFTAGTALVFGFSMLSNGLFTMGSPLHGFYGIGFCMVLVPGCFIAESGLVQLRTLSLWVAVIVLFYLWLMIVGFDPRGYAGLTQRISVFPMFGWFYFAGRALLRQQATTAGAGQPAMA